MFSFIRLAVVLVSLPSNGTLAKTMTKSVLEACLGLGKHTIIRQKKECVLGVEYVSGNAHWPSVDIKSCVLGTHQRPQQKKQPLFVELTISRRATQFCSTVGGHKVHF